uniref:Uncharacterized protein n=1 Tax=Nelumbo nucifera TaxID=4432 RepID=A0A822YSV0_NELNU|nr:TPA_asm: hypothetical protein HUJ06_011149 [Nelumbo nucifera]
MSREEHHFVAIAREEEHFEASSIDTTINVAFDDHMASSIDESTVLSGWCISDRSHHLSTWQEWVKNNPTVR